MPLGDIGLQLSSDKETAQDRSCRVCIREVQWGLLAHTAGLAHTVGLRLHLPQGGGLIYRRCLGVQAAIALAMSVDPKLKCMNGNTPGY